MAYLDFGYTWWGKKWLDALLNSECSNRLSRGKRYARNGSVKNIDISYKGVVARIKGDRPKPYAVTLSFPIFTKDEIERIVSCIVCNPLYLSSLLNRKLPMSLYQEFKRENVNFFPQSWADISSECDCPDWDDCCKHLVSIIYMLTNEIDQNPFLVFKLHGLDVFSELHKYGITLKEGKAQGIEFIHHWLETSEIDKVPIDLSFKQEDNELNFNQFPFLRDKVLSLLDENPLFYPQTNFKMLLLKVYKGVAKDAATAYAEIGRPSSIQAYSEYITVINVAFNGTLDETISIKRGVFKTGVVNSDVIDVATLYRELAAIPNKLLGHLTKDVRALHQVMSFSIKVLQVGAFIPEVVSLSETAYKLRWLPALLNKEVNILFKKLLEDMPSEMVTLKMTGLPSKPLKQEEALKLLVSLFLNYFISEYCYESYQFDLRNPILSFFFTGDLLEVKYLESKELPTTIALWLRRFYMTEKPYNPVLKVEEINVGFEISILVEHKANILKDYISLAEIVCNKEYEYVSLDIFKDLQSLETYFPEITRILETRGEETVVISKQAFPDLFFKQLPILKMLGISLLLPKGLESIVHPQLSLTAKPVSNNKGLASSGAHYLSLQELLVFDWEIALGNRVVKVKDFEKMLKDSRGIVKIKEQYVYFDENEIQKILKKSRHAPSLSSAEKLRTVLSGAYKGSKVIINKAVQELLSDIHNVSTVSLPPTILATLRPYQRRGYEWLYKNAKFGFGSLIADDMGLGKTVQVLTYLLKLKAEGAFKKHPALVVVPTTLLSNWEHEVIKFAPDLKVDIYHGTKRKLALNGQDVLLTSYGLVRRDRDKFNLFEWPALVIDEAQNIKNHSTAQTKAVKMLKATVKIAMTGTPVENRLFEYWSIFDFLNKGYLGCPESFKKEFIIPIEFDRAPHALATFKKITEPFILRRLKTDKRIIEDLPDKIEMDHFNQLSKQQVALYQSVVDNIMTQIKNEEGINRRGLIFKLMTHLKQICNHPAHFQKKKEILPSLSGKTGVLIDILDTIYENNEKVLIFTQYTEMGKLLQKLILDQYNTEALFFHGGLSRKKRDVMVERFQNEKVSHTMILSLKAGGTGLNLTAAKHVIHFDLWWNPAVEAQATDRAYRIGQKEKVMVYRMITKGTFEEKVNDMLGNKKELADLTISAGEKWIGSFSNQELRHVFELENVDS